MPIRLNKKRSTQPQTTSNMPTSVRTPSPNRKACRGLGYTAGKQRLSVQKTPLRHKRGPGEGLTPLDVMRMANGTGLAAKLLADPMVAGALNFRGRISKTGVGRLERALRSYVMDFVQLVAERDQAALTRKGLTANRKELNATMDAISKVELGAGLGLSVLTGMAKSIGLGLKTLATNTGKGAMEWWLQGVVAAEIQKGIVLPQLLAAARTPEEMAAVIVSFKAVVARITQAIQTRRRCGVDTLSPDQTAFVSKNYRPASIPNLKALQGISSSPFWGSLVQKSTITWERYRVTYPQLLAISDTPGQERFIKAQNHMIRGMTAIGKLFRAHEQVRAYISDTELQKRNEIKKSLSTVYLNALGGPVGAIGGILDVGFSLLKNAVFDSKKTQLGRLRKRIFQQAARAQAQLDLEVEGMLRSALRGR